MSFEKEVKLLQLQVSDILRKIKAKSTSWGQLLGDIVYANIAATITFPGNGEYYKIKAINTATRIVTIESSGSISSITLTCI